MSRKIADCRNMPSESGCTLTISGEEDEVVRAAVQHAVDVHGHTDGDELRAGVRASLADETAPTGPTTPTGPIASTASTTATAPTTAGAFVQLIEFRTSRINEFAAVEDEWRTKIGPARTARWEFTGADRDRPGTFIEVVEFPDHEQAMANSRDPVTSDFAHRLGELCDGDAVFRNLDVHRVTRF